MCVCVHERDNRPFHKGLGPSSTLRHRTRAGCPCKDLLSLPPFPLPFSLFHAFISLSQPLHSFAVNTINFKRLYWHISTHISHRLLTSSFADFAFFFPSLFTELLSMLAFLHLRTPWLLDVFLSPLSSSAVPHT